MLLLFLHPADLIGELSSVLTGLFIVVAAIVLFVGGLWSFIKIIDGVEKKKRT
jgi:high-affinity Fe2+/Pb2+ permease